MSFHCRRALGLITGPYPARERCVQPGVSAAALSSLICASQSRRFQVVSKPCPTPAAGAFAGFQPNLPAAASTPGFIFCLQDFEPNSRDPHRLRRHRVDMDHCEDFGVASRPAPSSSAERIVHRRESAPENCLRVGDIIDVLELLSPQEHVGNPRR